PIERTPDGPRQLASQCGQDARGSIHRVSIARGELIAEPKRYPRPVRSLRLGEEGQGTLRRYAYPLLQRLGQRCKPCGPRQQCMGRQVRTAAVKWQLAPTA